MSHFGNYIKERLGKGIVEDENGFATYYFAMPDCYIEDIYVIPEKRKAGIAAKYADEITKIAQDKKCINLIGSVKPTAKGSTDSLRVLLAYGFKLHSAVEDCIWFKKKLEE
jgi:GNAT superfamily N-acetyltransferase